jgi:mxaK protein
MNKVSQLSYWLLIAATTASAAVTVETAIELHDVNELNDFISHVDDYEVTPDNPKAMLAKAYVLTQQNEEQKALDVLTHITANDDQNVALPALLNRGNINLRKAMTIDPDDKKRIPLAELAKQDFRKALLINPEQWDVRYNLELALNIVPELPEVDVLFEKPNVLRQRTVESKGFKVDLP